MSDASSAQAREPLLAPETLQSIETQIGTADDLAEVCNLLQGRVAEAIGAPSAAVFFKDEENRTYTHASGNESLLPEAAVLEYAEKEGHPAIVPASTGSMMMVAPLRHDGALLGLLVLDIGPVAERVVDADDAPLLHLLDLSAARISKLRRDLLSGDRDSLVSNILESITNGILTLDSAGVITRVNRNAMMMLEIGAKEIGKPFKEVFHEDVATGLEAIITELNTSGFAMEQVIQRRFSSGEQLPIALSASVLSDRGGNRIGTIVIVRDMSATKEIDRLRRLDQLKTEFVSNVSHELKTPLTSIKAYTEALMDMASDDQQKHFLKVIDEESDRLLFLINDLLNVSRIQSGKMKLNLETVDPRSVITGILKISKVQSQKHELVLELSESLKPMPLDVEKMKEVAINLISNAIKYSPKGGKVWIRLNEHEGNLRLDIKDEGLGISPENQAKLFVPFFRVDSSWTAEIPGTGLGLTIVKAIVELHGGRISLQSEAGSGSTFTVLIPVRRQTTQAMDRMV